MNHHRGWCEIRPQEHALCLVYLRYPGNRTNGRINREDCCLSRGISEQEIILTTPTPLCPPEISKLLYHEKLTLVWKLSDCWIICFYGLRTPGGGRNGAKGKAGNRECCFFVATTIFSAVTEVWCCCFILTGQCRDAMETFTEAPWTHKA